YSKTGKLLGSSKSEIYNKGLLSKRINYGAYDDIVLKKHSFYTETEKIGTLKYISSYEPVFDNMGNLGLIINVPHFSRNIEHNLELSKFIVNFLNLYVAGLVALLVIA